MWPAELIKIAQYSPFNMAGVFLVFFLVRSLYNYLVDGDSGKKFMHEWKKAVLVWNSSYAEGNEIETFYKVCSLAELVNWY